MARATIFRHYSKALAVARGMRRSPMATFDDICVLDVHGNTLKRET